MDVIVWLRGLGLGRYEAAFRDNEIDETVLPSLTAEDLKELGITALGHRRKLLDAIAALRTDANAKAPPLEAPSILENSAQDTAERRQVTVMFSDLVGSTALSARMDPEDLREVISAYQTCVAETVRRFSGFVAKYMGDGVLVYFGYPQAHEDDAERAVRAGLALVDAVDALKTRASLQTRVGIATGLVVVGDLIGSGEAQERAIVGETPNLSARLQGIAEPNTVIIAESTQRLLGRLFELQDLGTKQLKDIVQPVRVWSALRPSSVESRFEALHAARLTTLVGREEELELLQRRWSKAKTGEGQVVLLSGEAGIGKSRLTAALLDHLAGEPHTRLRYFCSPQHTDSSLYPIIRQMERAAGLAHDDTGQAKLDKLDVMLAQTSTPKQDAALFAEMLSLPNDGRYPGLELPPALRRQKTLEALISQLQALTRQNPVLMVLEDAHCGDPTSLELFGRTVDRIASLRVLLLVTFRPEFQAPWVGRPHVTTLTINRLTRQGAEALIDSVVGNKVLSAGIRQDIIERTDGIPLFVEEMTKAVLEAGGEEAAQRAAAAIPSLVVSVPASLHASLMARLDRLGSAKEVAQIGAAIGREFSHALLAAVVRKPAAELGSGLERLIEAGLLFRHGAPPEATYFFKHALVQDAAYSTLLREPRRALHARIADAIESRFADIAEKQPELLARHCDEAGLSEKAAGLWGKAGHRSLARSALVESIGQLTRALAQIAALPATPALRREEIRLQVALITPLVNTTGVASRETRAAAERAHLLIERAQALGEPSEDPLLLFSVLYTATLAYFAVFKGDVVREAATQFLAFAERQRATVSLMRGHFLVGTSLYFTGDIAQAQPHLDQAMNLYDRAAHRPLVTRLGQDAQVSNFSYRSIIFWIRGFPDAAIADAEAALRDAREISHAATLIYALTIPSLSHTLCGNYAAAIAQLDEAVTLANEKSASFWKTTATILRGCVSALIFNAADATHMIISGLTAYRSTGATLWTPFYLSCLAGAYGELGNYDDAWRCFSEAASLVETSGERWSEAEVHRIAGEIALRSPEQDAAKANHISSVRSRSRVRSRQNPGNYAQQ